MNIKKYFKYLILVLIIYCVTFMFIFFYALYPLKFKKEILTYSNKHNISPQIIASIINTESSFNKNAISPKGAVGLMQLLPTTAKWLCEIQNIPYKYPDLFLPEININLGTYYIKYLINKFKNLNTAIVAYNAGEGTTSLWLENKNYSKDGKEINNIPYKETKNYLKKVTNAMKIYSIRF